MIDILNIPVFPGFYLSIMELQDTARLQLVNLFKNAVRCIDILLEKVP